MALGAAESEAQGVTLGVGASSYDLSGTGTSPVVSVRYDAPVAQRVHWQAGVGFFRYGSQGGRNVEILMPEGGVELHALSFPLYLGAGVGYTFESDGFEDEPTLYGALGLDLTIAERWALRPELRVRAVDPWVGTMADFTVGVRRQFR